MLRRLRGDSSPGEGGSVATRLVISGRRGCGPQASDEPHPTLMRTPAALLRRARRLCQAAGPGRSRYAFVPGVVAIRSSAGSPPARGRVPLSSAHGRGGSSGVASCAGRRGGGRVDLGWCFGIKPVFLETASADLVGPPTHRRGVARCTTADGKGGSGRRPIKAAGCRGYGPGHPRRTRDPVTGGVVVRAGPVGSR